MLTSDLTQLKSKQFHYSTFTFDQSFSNKVQISRGLTDISLIKNYIHLRYIDLSNNNLKDISGLNSLTHLLTIKLDFNKLTNIKLDPLPYLQHASFTNNKIRSTAGICHPKLEHLNLNSN